MAQINRPTDYFNTLTWTGNATDNRAITGVGFQPDFTWIKSRSNAQDHALFDSTRGANKQLVSSSTGAEATRTDMLKSFDSDGFTLGDDQTGASVNYNGYTYVGWLWKGGGTASSNTDGSITSSVSASTTSGFSIVSFTATGSTATIGHGLGTAPSMIIVKCRGTTSTWSVYHSSLGATKFLRLEDTTAVGTETGWWNNTNPTSSVFTIGTNHSANTQIAYCFAEKKGFSKFNSYVGNGSSDGVFCYTGFKPAFFIIKNTSTAGTNWVMFDNKRIGYNESNYYLRPSGSNAESTNIPLDILSNGFKIRTTAGDVNASGANYIYMCFAENPLVGTNNVPATAR